MADILKTESRQFFERTKAKLAVSIVVGASSMMLLGFGAYSAGQAASFNTMYYKYEKTQNDDYLKEAANNQLSGYGFASFCYVLATIMLISAAVYVSPVMCGSVMEQKMIKAPQEVEEGYADFGDGGTEKDA